MDQNHTDTEGTCGDELHGRAAGLNNFGAHYFVGWLLSAGFQRPEVMQAIKCVLGDMETDPGQQHCWTPDAPAVPGPAVEAASISAPETQPAVIARDTTPQLSILPAPPNPLADPAAPAPQPAPRPRLLAKILGTIFTRKRLAA